MSKHRFKYAERYALWRVYDMKCFYCERPIELANVTIDHILPKYLQDDPAELLRLVQSYDIESSFPNFDINNDSNWVPSDGCNFRKGKTIFPKKLTLFYLSEVQKKLSKVRVELVRLLEKRKSDKVLGELGSALELKVVTEEHVLELLGEINFATTRSEPLVITFGCVIEDVLESADVPADITSIANPGFYAHLCDWLEDELLKNLQSVSKAQLQYAEASHRDGEVLSVRFIFPDLSLDNIETIDFTGLQKVMPWWEVLEITNFYQIYGESFS